MEIWKKMWVGVFFSEHSVDADIDWPQVDNQSSYHCVGHVSGCCFCQNKATRCVVAHDISMYSVSWNITPAPKIGLSVIYSCRYLTFFNSQQVWECQNVLTAGHNMHLSLVNSGYAYFGGQCKWHGQQEVSIITVQSQFAETHFAESWKST